MLDKVNEIIERFDSVLGGTFNGRMISSTNTKFLKYCNEDTLLELRCLTLRIPEFLFRTSYVIKVERKQYELVINTRNSVYVTSISGKEPQGVIFEMSEEEIDIIEKFLDSTLWSAV